MPTITLSATPKGNGFQATVLAQESHQFPQKKNRRSFRPGGFPHSSDLSEAAAPHSHSIVPGGFDVTS